MRPEVVQSNVAQKIAQDIWDSGEDSVDLTHWCAERLAYYLPHLSELEINDVLDDVEHKVKSHLKREITHCREKGITPRYEFSEVSDVLYRARDIKIDEIRSKIKTIDWRNFEYLCKHLLEITGIEEAQVTRGTKEGGIDFFGVLRMRKFSQVILLSGLEIRIIGQAKHRSADKKIGDPEVKLFAKQYSDFKKRRGRGWKRVPDWFKRSNSPLVGMFITNAEFTGDADKAAKEEGIVIKNGDQIAEDLFCSPRIHEWLYIQEKDK